MSLPGFNNKKGKQENKGQKNNNQGSKFIPKQGKPANTQKKANRTGGTRGS